MPAVECAGPRDRAADACACAEAQGDFDTAAVIAGERVDLIHDLPPAGEIVAAMVRDAETLLKGGWTR